MKKGSAGNKKSVNYVTNSIYKGLQWIYMKYMNVSPLIRWAQDQGFVYRLVFIQNLIEKKETCQSTPWKRSLIMDGPHSVYVADCIDAFSQIN